MAYTISPSASAELSVAKLRTVTATYNAAARAFIIDPTSWGTIFRHSRIVHAAFPWRPIDAYSEHAIMPRKDGEPEVKLLPSNLSVIQVKHSDEVPRGALLLRVHGDEQLWMLHFPPQPLNQTPNVGNSVKTSEKEKPAVGEKGATQISGGPGNNKKVGQRSFGQVCPDFKHFHNMIHTEGKKSATFLDDFFAAYAVDVGSGITPNDVRVDFANDIADPEVRTYEPDQDAEFWEYLWKAVTRDGTLKGVASSHWSSGFDKMDPPLLSKVELALARHNKPVNPLEQYGNAIARAMTANWSEEHLKIVAELYKKESFRKQASSLDPRMKDDRYWDDFYSIFTRRGTLEGMTKHWNDKA